MKAFLTSATLSAVSLVSARTFTVYNHCPFTIWPAMFTDLNAGSAVPDYPTGWEAASYMSVSFSVPDNWTAGRIWARRDCDFSSNPGPNSCLDGGCNGGLECDLRLGPGGSDLDWYDISLVDGYNLPARIDNNVGCGIPSCPVDLGPNCPSPLKGPFDSSGFPVGCKSACDANLDGNQSNSPNCCTGQYNTAATCKPSGVADYSYFKDNCPNSYVYAYDESSGAALWTCNATLNADYTLTFCP
ncbi:thaumatin-like protein [Neolentinus lepideus HHB14362 ss-1]|uniref:Thaumatin-like protein n=1 Tax=Neolentinus lepideus HHB14362 ss-1 TaxID=1314782 RepID=A0A165N171_9AGAM|nr:thaumatin-like protein [Neolentinus lepideus HHB14362 ss-1]